MAHPMQHYGERDKKPPIDKHLYRRVWNEHANDDWPGQYEYVKVDGPVYQPDYMLAMVTYLMESGQRTKLRDIRAAVDAALGLVGVGEEQK